MASAQLQNGGRFWTVVRFKKSKYGMRGIVLKRMTNKSHRQQHGCLWMVLSTRWNQDSPQWWLESRNRQPLTGDSPEIIRYFEVFRCPNSCW